MLGFVLRNCFHLTDVDARRLQYLSLVRSHLSFGCEVWVPQGASADLLHLEGIQRQATNFILHDYELSYVGRLKKLNLIPLSYWHEIKDIIFLYKCKYGMYEIDINQYITQPLHHSTRSSSGDLRPNLCKTSLFRNSYFNTIVFLWNNLQSDIKSSSSVPILKSKLYIFCTKKLNSTFDVDRLRTWKSVCSKCRSLHTICCS